VCGNGYSVVVDILNGSVTGIGVFGFRQIWLAVLVIVACKWVATAASFGSGAPGGVFTPSLFMGASAGYLLGTAVHNFWPAVDARAFALVGMGAFLAAASRAPVMALIMLFEMTLSYDIILPLMVCNVVAYYTAKGLEESSLYSESLKRKRAETPPPFDLAARVADLTRPKPPLLAPTARFAEIARMFLNTAVNNLYVVDDAGKFLGAVSLHDIKPYLAEPALGELVLARDILHDDFPRVAPDAPLAEALGRFLGVSAERLPVVEHDGTLRGSLSKGDLLLALVEKRKRPAG
jgi:CIC family chloride channel protein